MHGLTGGIGYVSRDGADRRRKPVRIVCVAPNRNSVVEMNAVRRYATTIADVAVVEFEPIQPNAAPRVAQVWHFRQPGLCADGSKAQVRFQHRLVRWLK